MKTCAIDESWIPGVRLLAVALAIGLGIGGCNPAADEDDEVEDLTIVVEADKSRILEEEQALASKREEMQSEQTRLDRERAEVAERLASLSKKDRKTREKLEAEKDRLDAEEKKIRDRARRFDKERAKLAREKTELLERIATLTHRSGGLTIEQREAAIARRENVVGRREGVLARREADLANREAQVTKTLQELNSILAGLKAGGGTRTVVVNAPASSSSSGGGATATKSQAQKGQRNVRGRMDSKGILMDDLPPTAKTLFKQGNQSLSDKDYGEALGAYEQVIAIIDGIAIDQGFVSAKMGRLNRAMENKELDAAANKRVQALLSELSNAFADGRFDRANKKANQIAVVLKKN